MGLVSCLGGLLIGLYQSGLMCAGIGEYGTSYISSIYELFRIIFVMHVRYTFFETVLYLTIFYVMKITFLLN
jgi:hypothetical protein